MEVLEKKVKSEDTKPVGNSPITFDQFKSALQIMINKVTEETELGKNLKAFLGELENNRDSENYFNSVFANLDGQQGATMNDSYRLLGKIALINNGSDLQHIDKDEKKDCTNLDVVAAFASHTDDGSDVVKIDSSKYADLAGCVKTR